MIDQAVKNKNKEHKNVETEIIIVDTANEESVASMVNTVVAKWNRIDYAVNAAGIIPSPRLLLIKKSQGNWLTHICKMEQESAAHPNEQQTPASQNSTE